MSGGLPAEHPLGAPPALPASATALSAGRAATSRGGLPLQPPEFGPLLLLGGCGSLALARAGTGAWLPPANRLRGCAVAGADASSPLAVCGLEGAEEEVTEEPVLGELSPLGVERSEPPTHCRP
eukprot:jgi/Chrpa1/18610/Chrysochromulina_OHIO_Genome00009120-RA